MSSAVPAELKAVTPFVRRAGEVEKTGDARAYVVAYFCRTHAVQQGMALSGKSRSKEVSGFLMALMDALETAKKQHPDLADLPRCEDVVRTYAQEKLAEAESEYLSSAADKDTARRYYAAASFFEVLATFAEDKRLDEGTKKSALFAKWRATEILKALKEGRAPIPDEAELAKARGAASDDDDGGNAGSGRRDDDDDDEEEDDMPSAPPPAPTGRVARRAVVSDDSDDAGAASAASARRGRNEHKKAAAVSKRGSRGAPRGGGGGGMDEGKKADAMEYTRFALRAFEMDDIEMARKHLESALREIDA